MLDCRFSLSCEAGAFRHFSGMLLKDTDDKTPDLDRLQELLDRSGLTPRQRDLIVKEMDNLRTGYRGEKDAAYFLNDAFRDAENTILIHDLRLEQGSRVAQIDHLLIHRFRRAYVLETKSMNANLACSDKGEWTAWYGSGKHGKPYPIESPIEQVRRHCSVLDTWFKANGLTRMERIEPIVIVSPKSFVTKTRAKGDEHIPVIRADLFYRWWLNERNSGGENAIGALWRLASMFSAADLLKIGELLVANHRPQLWDWETRFGVRAVAPKLTQEEPSFTPSMLVPEPPPSAAASLPVQAAKLEASLLVQPIADPVTIPASDLIVPAIPLAIETAFGVVTVKRVSDGLYALRHDGGTGLADHIRQSVHPHGRWQPRFKNWLIEDEYIRQIVSRLQDTLP